MPEPRHPVTRQVRRLIDAAHRGNLNEASRVTGLAYPTLRDLYVGETVNPSMQTLQALQSTYSVDLAWFSEDGHAGPVLPGIVGFLPEPGLTSEAIARRVLIPFAAWPMYRVFQVLEHRLRQLPRSKQRPIVGKARGEKFDLRLTTFLLRPLLLAEELGDEDAVVLLEEYEAVGLDADRRRERWVTRLTALGKSWLEILSDLAEASVD